MTSPSSRESAFPLLIAALAIFVLSTMDALIKALPFARETMAVMLVRYGLGLPFALGAMLALKAGWPSARQWRGHALRTGCFLVAASLFFFALARLPFAEVFALTYTSPIFAGLFGWLLLKEQVGNRTIVALVIGFAGVLLIVLTMPPQAAGARAADASLGALAAILSALAFGFGVVLIRKHATSEPSIRLEAMQRIVGTAVLLPVCLALGLPEKLGPQLTSGGAMLWTQMLAIGAVGTFGGWLLSQAFARAPAVRVMSIEYTGLIWASLYGLLFFSERPRILLFVGAAIIIAAAIYAMTAKAVTPEPHEVQEVV
jgi:drug/metabolite transporter (DMT)-like permease